MALTRPSIPYTIPQEEPAPQYEPTVLPEEAPAEPTPAPVTPEQEPVPA